MPESRTQGVLGRTPPECSIKDGTNIRGLSPEPGSVGRAPQLKAAQDILKRILQWRAMADFSGFYPNAVKALDHFLAATGTFVLIPDSKVSSVRADTEAAHLKKARDAFRNSAIMEAAAVWQAAHGIPSRGGRLKPPRIEFSMTYQTGASSGGLTDDNLTYYGSTILSEVQFSAEQKTIPSDYDDENFQIELKVLTWKSWVVDNYDWEGDKKFGLFPLLGLPTQKEMNLLHQTGVARSYQRSSYSWSVKTHGLSPWTETRYSMKTFKEAAQHRQNTHQRREKQRERERKDGALPTPRPAEEMEHCFTPPAKR